MKELKIMFLLLLPFLGSGQNVQINTQGAAQSPAAILDLSSNNVNNSLLGNFQDRAKEKLEDFYNYLTIISNQTYSKEMRDEAKKQAEQLFYGTGCNINGKPVNEYIDSCYQLKNHTEWKATGIMVSENMSPTGNAADSSHYSGALNFKVSVNNILSGVKNATIILSKNEKDFGNTRQDVWTVFICTIN